MDLTEKLRLAAKSTKPEVTSSFLKLFIFDVRLYSGKLINRSAADMLVADAKYVIAHLPDTTPPVISIISPRPITYPRYGVIIVNFWVDDSITGVDTVTATLDGAPVKLFDTIYLSKLSRGSHTLTVTAVDVAGNSATKSVVFQVK
jgi:hypothetical protein